MHSHISHDSVPQHSYGSGAYTYSPAIYDQNSFPYNNASMHATLSTAPSGSPQDYQCFSVPSYHSNPNQYLGARPQTVHPSGSSTADSNGSIVSEFDSGHNPMKKRRKQAPTIATGRRNLKDETVNNEEAERRNKRRERNRKSAQRCRERKIEKKDALEREISNTNITCERYLELAENVLKAWKQRLHILNERLPCNNYTSQLSVVEFENLIDLMHSRKKTNSETSETCTVSNDVTVDNDGKQEFSLLLPQIASPFPTCNKGDSYYRLFDNNTMREVANSDFDQYHNCVQDSNISYI